MWRAIFSEKKVDIVFLNCIVRYNGGSIPKKLLNATFDKCLFIISLEGMPVPEGRDRLQEFC